MVPRRLSRRLFPVLAALCLGLAATDSIAGAPLIVPVEGVAPEALRDTWGEARGAGREHQGIDIPAPLGTPVLAVRDGTVAKRFLSELGGVTLYLFGPDGIFVYYYAHLQGYAEGVVEGAGVRAGETVGYVGETGNARDPHLHFEIGVLDEEPRWWISEPLNPYYFLVDILD